MTLARRLIPMLGGTVPVEEEPAPAGYDGAVLADAPVSYWPLQEAAGAGSFADVQGVSDMVPVGSPTAGEPGLIPNATSVAFAPATNDRVQAPWVATYDWAGWGALSLDLWLYLNSQRNYNTLVNIANSGNRGRPLDLYHDGAGRLVHSWNNSGANYSSSGLVPIASPFHFALTVGGGRMKMYVDGSLVRDVAAAAPAGYQEAIRLGRRADGATELAGRASHFALYDYELTAAQVSAHHAAGL